MSTDLVAVAVARHEPRGPLVVGSGPFSTLVRLESAGSVRDLIVRLEERPRCGLVFDDGSGWWRLVATTPSGFRASPAGEG